ncbi:alpha/beta hydrolase [Chitinilyticum litopenaei]|uniref:alpha/beta hydrolase n=1 Tax=Chitinilyticum litopenaei TaxID=1121276 RepID=UPI000410ABF8|nr:carbohydrate-binding protein [Chitinilyticum litopenaei]
MKIIAPLFGGMLLAASFPLLAALPLTPKLSHDNYAAEWRPDVAYVAGNVVSYQGQQYRTKWWSQNTPPQPTNWSSWQRLDVIPDGDYTLKLQSGHASRVDWYENDVLIATQNLTPAAAQTTELAVRGRSKGSYTYKAVLSNAEGQTSSTPLPVQVLDEEKYKIGVRTFNFTDMNRLDPLADTPRQRELMVKLWYPASLNSNQPVLHHWYHSEKAITGSPGDDWLKDVPSQSRLNAELAAKESPFPVLLFSPGYSANLESSQFLYEALAKAGYVVVVIGHTHQHSLVTMANGEEIRIDWSKRANDFDGGITFDELNSLMASLKDQPLTDAVKQQIYDAFAKCTGDHRQLKLWQDDTRFVLAELEKLNANSNSVFAKRLDLSRIGLLGTSYGGSKSLQYLSEIDNPAIRAAANIDGQDYYLTAQHQFNKPILMMSTESWVSKDFELIFDKARSDAYHVKIKGSLHGDITDSTVLAAQFKPSEFLGPINGDTMLAITNGSVLAFFNQYVKTQPQAPVRKNVLEFLNGYSEPQVQFKLQ